MCHDSSRCTAVHDRQQRSSDTSNEDQYRKAATVSCLFHGFELTGSNLHGIAQLLSRLTIKPFFEQYFKADEYARHIVKAGEDLSDFVQIFEVGSF
jgi:hypothetical protein